MIKTYVCVFRREDSIWVNVLLPSTACTGRRPEFEKRAGRKARYMHFMTKELTSLQEKRSRFLFMSLVKVDEKAPSVALFRRSWYPDSPLTYTVQREWRSLRSPERYHSSSGRKGQRCVIGTLRQPDPERPFFFSVCLFMHFDLRGQKCRQARTEEKNAAHENGKAWQTANAGLLWILFTDAKMDRLKPGDPHTGERAVYLCRSDSEIFSQIRWECWIRFLSHGVLSISRQIFSMEA